MVKKSKSYGVVKLSVESLRRATRSKRESGQTSENAPSVSGERKQKESLSAESSPTAGENESKAYLDSSALIKLYVTEAHSTEVAHFVSMLAHALPFSHLHDLEMKNGLRLKVFRQEASNESVEAAR